MELHFAISESMTCPGIGDVNSVSCFEYFFAKSEVGVI